MANPHHGTYIWASLLRSCYAPTPVLTSGNISPGLISYGPPMFTRLPLAGIRVIDFGRYIAGPYCGMLLSDMGADVIRIDRRQGSEDRYPGPITEGREGGGYISMNRNKRSLTLDTSKPGSTEIIRRLAKGADVVIANLPVTVLKKMGIDYDSLRAVKPDIILARISTFGPDGPYANRVGFDK